METAKTCKKPLKCGNRRLSDIPMLCFFFSFSQTSKRQKYHGNTYFLVGGDVTSSQITLLFQSFCASILPKVTAERDVLLTM